MPPRLAARLTVNAFVMLGRCVCHYASTLSRCALLDPRELGGGRSGDSNAGLGKIVEVELVGDECQSFARICPNVDALAGRDGMFEKTIGL